MTRVWRWWCAYWLAPGGRYATAMMRIALAVSLLWMLRRYAEPPPASAYFFKHGIWLLFPGTPTDGLRQLLVQIGWCATLAMLVGLWSRAAHAVSLVACMAVAAYSVSDLAAWSHTDVPPILASVAFLGARSGGAISIDAWWARRRGKSVPPSTQASIRLVQLAVAGVFASAAMSKLKAGGWTLDWALSDSLRHHLLARFDWVNVPRTPIASWLLESSTRYELAALLNFGSQLAPLATLFLFRYPKLRALAGACFVAEVLGLRYVMNLWNPHWIPLAAVFVDWDALFRPPRPAEQPAPRTPWWPTAFVAFFTLNASWLNQRLNAFPFSAFPMFAQVRAKRPYDVHQTYEMPGSHIVVFGSRVLNPDEQSWIDSSGRYRWFWRIRDPEELHAAMVGLLAEARIMFPSLGVTRVRLYYARFQAPAYPAPARLDRTDLAIIAETSDAGVVTHVGAPLDATMIAIPDLAAAPIPITAAVLSRTTIIATAPGPDGESWLVR